VKTKRIDLDFSEDELRVLFTALVGLDDWDIGAGPLLHRIERALVELERTA
jgi:hypothetical protein